MLRLLKFILKLKKPYPCNVAEISFRRLRGGILNTACLPRYVNPRRNFRHPPITRRVQLYFRRIWISLREFVRWRQEENHAKFRCRALPTPRVCDSVTLSRDCYATAKITFACERPTVISTCDATAKKKGYKLAPIAKLRVFVLFAFYAFQSVFLRTSVFHVVLKTFTIILLWDLYVFREFLDEWTERTIDFLEFYLKHIRDTRHKKKSMLSSSADQDTMTPNDSWIFLCQDTNEFIL